VVKETLLPRKRLFASERHLRHQAMQIGYKTPLPTVAHGITGFRVPLHSPICSLSLLFSPTKFSTNKMVPTSAVRACLCFHSQSRLKKPEHLKFLRMSSVHHLAVLVPFFNRILFKLEALNSWKMARCTSYKINK
jgi:hypothetical protein